MIIVNSKKLKLQWLELVKPIDIETHRLVQLATHAACVDSRFVARALPNAGNVDKSFVANVQTSAITVESCLGLIAVASRHYPMARFVKNVPHYLSNNTLLNTAILAKSDRTQGVADRAVGFLKFLYKQYSVPDDEAHIATNNWRDHIQVSVITSV